VIAGALFLFRRTVPLALTLAGPLIVNILLFHVLMDPAGIAPGLVVTTLWFVIYWQFRAAFLRSFLHRNTIRSRAMTILKALRPKNADKVHRT